MSVIWFNEDIPRLQRPHARPKCSCLFREHSLQRLHIFGPKPRVALFYRIYVRISNMSVIWFNEDIPPLQRYHARQKWSYLFREYSLQRLNVTISNMSVVWFNEDIPRLQQHHDRPMWSCLFREHSLQMLHVFGPKS